MTIIQNAKLTRTKERKMSKSKEIEREHPISNTDHISAIVAKEVMSERPCTFFFYVSKICGQSSCEGNHCIQWEAHYLE